MPRCRRQLRELAALGQIAVDARHPLIHTSHAVVACRVEAAMSDRSESGELVVRCDCGFASGCAIERRSALKKSRNGPASAALVAVSRAKIDNQTTILRSGRFTTMTNIGRITRRMLVPLGPVAAAVSVTIPICRASVSDFG